MRKHKAMAFLFHVIFLFSGRLEAEEGIRIHEDTFLDSRQDALHRSIIGFNGISAFYLDTPSSICSGGFSCSLFSVGNLYTKGLFRIMENPLGFMPDSSVFMETSGLHLNPSFSRNPRFSFAVNLIPETCSFFIRQSDDNQVNFGTQVCIPWSRHLQTEIIFQMHRFDSRLPTDDWFLENQAPAAGRLYTAASRLTVKAGDVKIVVCGGFSSGETMLPGFFGLVESCIKIDTLSLSSLFGWQAPEYFSPSLHQSSDRFSAGANINFSPHSSFVLRCTYKYRMLQNAFPESPSLKDSHSLSGNAHLQFLKEKYCQAFASMFVAGEINPQPDTLKTEFEIGLRLKLLMFDDHRIQSEYRLKTSDVSVVHDIRLAYGISFPRLTILFTCDFDTTQAGCLGGILLHVSFSDCRFSLQYQQPIGAADSHHAVKLSLEHSF